MTVTAVDQRPGSTDGTETLTNIQSYKFSDGLVLSQAQLLSTPVAGDPLSLAGTAGSLGVTVNPTVAPATFQISGGQNLEIFGPTSQTVKFASNAYGTLSLDSPSTFTGSVGGLSHGNTNMIDLVDLAFGSGIKASYTGTTTAGTLTLTSGSVTEKISLTGMSGLASASASAFHLSSDGAHGTLVNI